MAHYTRFEIFLPVVYHKKKRDPQTGEIMRDPLTGDEQKERKALEDVSLRQFVNEACAKYKGLTQANPIDPSLYKGWWQEHPNKGIEIDNLTFLFGLVRIDQSDEALTFFSTWKQRFEAELEQKIVLVVYFPVQTIGEFF